MKTDNFVRWAREYGVHELVYRLRCHQTTIESWLSRRFIPSIAHMRELVRLAEGKISYADIIEPYLDKVE